MGGMDSTVASASLTSWVLAGLKRTTIGIPFRSVIRCRLVPVLARSVGFGPVLGPLLERQRWKSRSEIFSNQYGLLVQVRLRRFFGFFPKFQASAISPAAAKPTFRNRSPFPGVNLPTEFLFSIQTQSL